MIFCILTFFFFKDRNMNFATTKKSLSSCVKKHLSCHYWPYKLLFGVKLHTSVKLDFFFATWKDEMRTKLIRLKCLCLQISFSSSTSANMLWQLIQATKVLSYRKPKQAWRWTSSNDTIIKMGVKIQACWPICIFMKKL